MQPIDFAAFQPRFSWGEIRQALGQHDAGWRFALVMGALLATAAVAIGILISVFGRLALDGALFLVLLFGLGAMTMFDIIHQMITMQRVRRFALANGFVFEADTTGPDRPGILFRDRWATIMESLRTPGSPFLEYGNFQLIGPRSGRSSFAATHGYMRLQLPRRMPNIMLQSRRSRLRLPISFSKDQTLSLEGNFNDYYTLYAPKDYETDALYVFTPDIMELFMAFAKVCDCELVDDELYIYAQRPFHLMSPAEISQLLQVANQLLTKFDRQIDYYADERVGDRAANTIAAPGQRLRDNRLLSNLVFSVAMTLVYCGILWLIHH